MSNTTTDIFWIIPLLLQTTVTDTSNARRDILLAIIAGAVTITITLGPILINRWMDKLKEEREAAAKMVADAAEVVAIKVEEVKEAAFSTGAGIKQLQVTADATKVVADKTHEIANSRFDEIRNELRLSNENNQRMTEILTRAGILAPEKPPASGVVAEPSGERRVGDPDRREPV